MIGGIIEQVIATDGFEILWVRDDNDYCCVNVRLNGIPVSEGDRVWWQDKFCCWTPRDDSKRDVRIERSGYSYSPDASSKLGYVLIDDGGVVMVSGETRIRRGLSNQ